LLARSDIRALAAAVALALAGTAIAYPAWAGQPAIYTPAFSNLAVEGHDVVAYFAEGAPRRGDARFTAVHKGAEFRFASAANLARFQANPETFAPQYGGYCAWAVSRGYTAKSDPRAWKIVGGKLYLNYDANVQKRWAADIPGNIAKADRNWPGVLK
jgi:YHS domain-containing protein